MTAANKETPMQRLIVSEVARRLPGVRPKDISDLFYQRKLDDTICPVVGGRRLIPEDYVPEIVAALRAAGRLPALQEAAHAE
jgi:hypothetical protein